MTLKTIAARLKAYCDANDVEAIEDEVEALIELAECSTLSVEPVALERLTKKAFPWGPQVIVNNDDWRGQLVVRWADVKAILK